MNKLPKISIIIPTLNDAEGLLKCIKSIERQAYPKNLIEIIVIDDGSTDNTMGVAKKYATKVLVNGQRDVYKSWAMGLHASKGEYSYMLEQEIELRGNHFFQKMLNPLVKDKSITASFTRKYPRADQPWITRFISYHPSQCDPLYEFFTPSVESTFVKEKSGYIICDYSSGEIPPFGRMFYRMSCLRNSGLWENNRWYDLDTILVLVKEGYTKYAYVPTAGLYHKHAKTLSQLTNKRIRNLKNHYLPEFSKLRYKWLDLDSKKGVLKIIFWVIYANLIIPATIRGLIRAIKHKDLVLLMEPIVTVFPTDVILWNFVRIPAGRSIIRKAIRTLV